MIVNQSYIVEELKKGNVVGIPTDTVYGLAVLENSKNLIYDLKNRDPDKKLISFIYSYEQIGTVDDFTKDELKDIANQYWPGNNTLILRKYGELVSFRIPKEKNVVSLLKEIGEPLLTTSANISGQAPALTMEDFEKKFSNIPLLEEKIRSSKSGNPSNIYIFEKDKVQKIR